MESLTQEPAAVTLKRHFTGVQGWGKHFSVVKDKWTDAFWRLFVCNDCYQSLGYFTILNETLQLV